MTGSPAAITAAQLKNMQVQLVAKDSHPTVQLKGGEYKSGSDPASPDYADVRLDTAHMAFGDLNGDGSSDAAVLLAENYGGTGVFVSLVAVLNEGGQPVQAGATLIDDRPAPNIVSIQGREIVLDVKVHGPNDPACCAAQPITDGYALTRSGLTLLTRASKAPDGTERVLHIDSPVNGEQAAPGPLQVKGTYTVTPFEGTLAYHVYDEQRNTVAAGPLLTNPASSGSGVTFDGTIDLTGLEKGRLIRVEIADVSAADGSTIAMDSVELMIKWPAFRLRPRAPAGVSAAQGAHGAPTRGATRAHPL
ncbi:MAG: Gmad2 immunoglobulin-like domain-containing protein [Anaerolineae bacterium]